MKQILCYIKQQLLHAKPITQSNLVGVCNYNIFWHVITRSNLLIFCLLTSPCQLTELVSHACIIHVVINHKNNCSMPLSSSKAIIQFREDRQNVIVHDISGFFRHIINHIMHGLTTQTFQKAINAS